MTRAKVITFFVFISFLFGFANKGLFAAFDCLTLTTSSAQADKDYCRSELAQIEAQLTELLNKQKEQPKEGTHDQQ